MMTPAIQPLLQADQSGTVPVFLLDPQTRHLFSSNFDRKPFLFQHSLHTMDIFSMAALLKLAKKCIQDLDQHVRIGVLLKVFAVQVDGLHALGKARR